MLIHRISREVLVELLDLLLRQLISLLFEVLEVGSNGFLLYRNHDRFALLLLLQHKESLVDLTEILVKGLDRCQLLLVQLVVLSIKNAIIVVLKVQC